MNTQVSDAFGEGLDLIESDKAHHLHPFTDLAEFAISGPRMIVRGQRCHVWDNTGNRYLDAMAGLWCVNVGYGRAEIASAMAAQAQKLAYHPAFAAMTSEPAARLSGELSRWLPSALTRVFFGLSGSDANDTAVKIIWLYNNLRGRPEKKKLIARQRAYHGVSLASNALSALPALRDGFDVHLPRMIHVTTPSYYWHAEPGMTEQEFSSGLGEELARRIEAEGPETVAAFFAEPVLGAGGVYTPPEGYFSAIQGVLRRYDVLLVADEVICGFGRLGSPSGSALYRISPDLMTLAKGLTSGYAPLSSVVLTEAIFEVLRERAGEAGLFGHGYTYSAHPTSCAVALENLAILAREQLVHRAADLGTYLQRSLRQAFEGHPLVGEVRGTGLIAAVELVADRTNKRRFEPSLRVARRVYRACLSRGLLTRALNNADILAVAPPLVVEKEEIDEAVGGLLAGVNVVRDELLRAGEWSEAHG